jgi:GT2 family glycosyltransferase
VSDAVPDDARRLADERSAARARRDWATADTLREELRALGWEPVDADAGSTLRPVLPSAGTGPDAGAGAVTGYTRPEHLASLLAEPATLDASLVTIVDDHAADLERLVRGLAAHPAGVAWELVVVANAPAEPIDEAALADLPGAVLPSTARLGWADAANLGLRRTRGAVLVLLDGSVEPTGDFLAPLRAAFDDPAVGVAGPWGVTSTDARHFTDAPPGEVDAILGYCLAIRREALAEVGGFDHRFRWYRNADLDLSFAVRDRGWRAVATESLPLERHEHRGWTQLSEEERDRQSRRNFYRFLKHWGSRPDLLLGERD